MQEMLENRTEFEVAEESILQTDQSEDDPYPTIPQTVSTTLKGSAL